MEDQDKQQAPAAEPKRGEAAWKAQKDAIASRNAQAKKEGSRQRQEQDQQRAAHRRAAELRERAEMAKSRP